ncbi:MAG TPA: universal stress protein [Gaiellaceae bacterium]|nr:universal stress protein [Gaiellaceae bacterium]
MNDIIVATDGSRSATAAVEEGLKLAEKLGVGVTFVAVHRAPPRILGDPFYERNVSQGLHEAHQAVDDALARAEATGVRATGEVLEGNAADEIVALADNRDSAMVVMGSRGHGPVVGALLGSVSAGVVQQARRPVVIVNPGPPVEKRNTWAA